MCRSAVALFAMPARSFAAGPNAIQTPTGYNANATARGDDTSNLIVNLPFAMNWNGTNYTQIYINTNGNCTFGAGYTGYNPNTTLAAPNRNIMAPFWADLDTRNTATGQVTYSTTTAGNIPQVNGRNAFFVNWVNVASYNNQATPLKPFQLVLCPPLRHWGRKLRHHLQLRSGDVGHRHHSLDVSGARRAGPGRHGLRAAGFRRRAGCASAPLRSLCPVHR